MASSNNRGHAKIHSFTVKCAEKIVQWNVVTQTIVKLVIILLDEVGAAAPANFPYTWDMKVTEAMANGKKCQVMHFPKGEISRALENTTRIRIRSEDSKFNFSAFIKTAKRNKRERYIGKTWYEYVRCHRPKPGDLIVFTLIKYKLYVKLVRRENRPNFKRI